MVLLDVNSDDDVLELFIDGVSNGVLVNPAPNESPKLKASERFTNHVPGDLMGRLKELYSAKHIQSLYGKATELPEYTLTRKILQDFMYREEVEQFFNNYSENGGLDFLSGRTILSRSRVVDIGLTALLIDHHLEQGLLSYETPNRIKLERI
jgi:hypothetical protein